MRALLIWILFRLCAEFESVAEKVLSVPSDTAGLMSLIAYVDKLETVTVHTLDKKLINAVNRLSCLVDYATISPADMRLNITTFSWLGRMSGIVKEHKKIAASKRTLFQELLNVSCLKILILFVIA